MLTPPVKTVYNPSQGPKVMVITSITDPTPSPTNLPHTHCLPHTHSLPWHTPIPLRPLPPYTHPYTPHTPCTPFPLPPRTHLHTRHTSHSPTPDKVSCPLPHIFPDTLHPHHLHPSYTLPHQLPKNRRREEAGLDTVGHNLSVTGKEV